MWEVIHVYTHIAHLPASCISATQPFLHMSVARAGPKTEPQQPFAHSGNSCLLPSSHAVDGGNPAEFDSTAYVCMFLHRLGNSFNCKRWEASGL